MTWANLNLLVTPFVFKGCLGFILKHKGGDILCFSCQQIARKDLSKQRIDPNEFSVCIQSLISRITLCHRFSLLSKNSSVSLTLALDDMFRHYDEHGIFGVHSKYTVMLQDILYTIHDRHVFDCQFVWVENCPCLAHGHTKCPWWGDSVTSVHSLTLILWEDHMKGSQSAHLFPMSQGDAYLRHSKNWDPVICLVSVLVSLFGSWSVLEQRSPGREWRFIHFPPCSGEGMQVRRRVSSQTKNNESFTVLVSRGSDECTGILSSHSLTDANATPCGQLSVLRSSFQISTKGKLLMQQAWLVKPAGAMEWCWCFDCWPRSL